MKFKIGDKIRFLNEVGGGRIVGFTDKNIVNVSDDDGFDIPVLISEIVKVDDAPDEPESPKEAKNEVIHEDTRQVQKSGETIFDGSFGVYFGLVQDDKVYKLYLINDSDHSIYFCVSIFGEKFDSHFKSGQLEDNTKLFLDSLSKEELHQIKKLRFQVMFYTDASFEFVKPATKEVAFNKVLLKEDNFASNDFFNSKAQLFKIENEDLAEEIAKLKKSDFSKIIVEKEGLPTTTLGDLIKKEKKPKNEIEEVDLHIEEILENWKDMSPGAILNAQLSRFEIALETAIKSNTKRIVFIHGVGNGKLKYELRKKLDVKFPDLRYQDASFKEYGYGATMVIIA